MADITTRADIEWVVEHFYNKALHDNFIGHFFSDLNLEQHLPRISDFWDNMLFRTGAYKGGMMYAHFLLNARHTMEKEHFYRWLELFEATVDQGFAGERADSMKQTALSLARTIYGRIEEQKAFPSTKTAIQ